jgi:protein-tyrosine phosphatase
MNRSDAAVAAYLMYKHGWDRDEALAYVRARRHQVQPNPTLMGLLGEWEWALKREQLKPK